MKKHELYWLAGILEGEGCFGLYAIGRSGHKYPRIQLTMCDEDIVTRAIMFMGGKVHGPYKKKNRKPRWVGYVPSGKAIAMMRQLFPLMGKRRRKKILEIIKAWSREPVPRKLGRPIH